MHIPPPAPRTAAQIAKDQRDRQAAKFLQELLALPDMKERADMHRMVSQQNSYFRATGELW